MLLHATLFVSFSGLSLATLPTPDTNAQCPLIVETHTGPGVWLPTADAVISPASQATGGSWNDVLGHTTVDDSQESFGAGTVISQAKHSTRVTNWGNWDSQPTLSAFVGNTQPGVNTALPAPPAISPATTSIGIFEPFVMYISTAQANHPVLFVRFLNNIAVACDEQEDATVVMLDEAGRIQLLSEDLFLAPSSNFETATITLSDNLSSSTLGWSSNGTSLQLSHASLCLGGNQEIQIVFDKVPTDCVPIQLAGDKYCVSCTPRNTTPATSQTTVISATASTLQANGTKISNATTDLSSTTTTSFSASTTISSTITSTSITPIKGTNSTSIISNSTITNSTAVTFFPTNTTTDENGTTIAISGPMDYGSAPQINLTFLQPPDIDIGSLDRFIAQPNVNIWFGGQDADGTTSDGAVTVRVAMNFSYPSVMLDHSMYITGIFCTSTSISGSINNTVAFSRAQAEWTQKPLLFITSTSSCVPDGESAFFMLASDISFDSVSTTFVLSGAVVDISDVVDDLGIDFGNIDYATPSSNNATSNSTVSSSCTSPSSSVIQGLPAAGCGANFDQTLDDTLGYYSASGDEQFVLSAAAPGAASPNASLNTRRGIASGPNLTPRGKKKESKVKEEFHKLEHKVETGAKEVTHAISTGINKGLDHIGSAIKSDVSGVLKTAGDFAVKAIKATIHFGVAAAKNGYKVAKALVTGDYSNTFHVPIEMGPKPAILVDSPWGDAFKVLEWKPKEGTEKFNLAKTALDKIASSLIGEPDPEPGVEFFCVDCEVDGKFTITGSISATPKSGWKKATIDIKRNLTAGLFIGVNAFAAYDKSYEVVLFTQGLPGWEIPGIIALGPLLSLGVSADLNISAQGQLMTGAKLTWDAMAAHLDFLHHDNSSQSGWKPTLDHKFDVAGTLGAEASLGLAIELGLGILVLNKYGRSLALRDTPAIAAHTSLAADYNVTTGASVGSDECPGIEWSVGFENKVTLGFKKQTKKDKEEVELEDGPTYTLAQWEAPPLAEGCVKLRAGGGSGKESGEEKQPAANDTCAYWAGGKEWTDPRANNWVFLCDVAASQLTNRRLINQFNSSSMLDCFSTCHFNNQQCEQAVFLQGQKKCGWTVTATCDPTDTACAASGSMLTTCTTDCPSTLAANFDAVSMPVSPFTIYSASYKQIDITSEVQAWWNKGHWISTQYVDLLYRFPQIGDPAAGDVKTYYMFYSYNGEYRSFASLVTTKYIIQAGPIQYPQAQRITADPENYRLAAVNKGYSAASWLKIYDFNFGTIPLPTTELSNIMDYWYNHLSGASQIEIQLAAFDNYDSYHGYNKAGTVYFSSFVKTPGVIGYAQNIEGAYIQEAAFNPPASSNKRAPYPRFSRRVDNSTSADALNTTTTSNSTSDINLAILTDMNGDLTLQLGTDGNLWLSTADVDSTDITNLTTGEYLIGVQQPSEQILGDSAGNLLHYFPDEVSVTGASRLRLAPWNKLPRSSQIVSLVNMNGTDADDQVIVAVDTQGNYAWVWVCTYMDQLNRIFVTNSAVGSADAFATLTTEYTVTGGNATECNPLTLTPNWDDDSI